MKLMSKALEVNQCMNFQIFRLLLPFFRTFLVNYMFCSLWDVCRCRESGEAQYIYIYLFINIFIFIYLYTFRYIYFYISI